jgi:hypothetical protein
VLARARGGGAGVAGGGGGDGVVDLAPGVRVMGWLERLVWLLASAVILYALVCLCYDP